MEAALKSASKPTKTGQYTTDYQGRPGVWEGDCLTAKHLKQGCEVYLVLLSFSRSLGRATRGHAPMATEVPNPSYRLSPKSCCRSTSMEHLSRSIYSSLTFRPVARHTL